VAGFRSKAVATRCPVPVSSRTREFPEDQAPLFTISCTTAERSGLRSAEPTAPVVQAGGDQTTEPRVRGREDRFAFVDWKRGALAWFWPWIRRLLA
jgi:hypothetical protein